MIIKKHALEKPIWTTLINITMQIRDEYYAYFSVDPLPCIHPSQS